MSLNWNIEKVKDWKEIADGGDESVTTGVLVDLTMSVGFGTITKTNADEFYARVHLMELINGAYRNKAGKPIMFTKEDIVRRIGLDTNAGTFSRAEFIKRRMKWYFRDMGLEAK
jgi:hypothetical protein